MIKKILLILFVAFMKLSISQCSVQIAINNLDCVDENNNSLIANTTGQAPFQYIWSNGDTTNIADSVAYNDTLSVTIIDNIGCIASDTAISITNPIYPMSSTVTNASCQTCCDGSISFTPVNPSTLCNIVSYDWYSGVFIGTTSTPFLSNLCIATYTIMINTDCTCSNPVVFTVGSSVGLNNRNDQEQSGFIYPNPAQDHFSFIPNFNSYDYGTIQITNIVGQSVFTKVISNSEKEIRIDTQRLENGIYFYHIIVNGRKVFSQSIVISK